MVTLNCVFVSGRVGFGTAGLRRSSDCMVMKSAYDEEVVDPESVDSRQAIRGGSDTVIAEVPSVGLTPKHGRITWFQLLTAMHIVSLFSFFITSGICTKLYSWTKLIDSQCFLGVKLLTWLWLKTVSEFLVATIGLYSWWHESFEQPCCPFKKRGVLKYIVFSIFIDAVIGFGSGMGIVCTMSARVGTPFIVPSFFLIVILFFSLGSLISALFFFRNKWGLICGVSTRTKYATLDDSDAEDDGEESTSAEEKEEAPV